MPPILTKKQALLIAQEYINERNKRFQQSNQSYIPHTIHSDFNKSVQYYETFFGLTGGAWVVEKR